MPLIEAVEAYTAESHGSVDAAAKALVLRCKEALGQPRLCTDIEPLRQHGSLCPSNVRLSATQDVIMEVDARLRSTFSELASWGIQQWEIPGFSDNARKYLASLLRDDDIRYFFVIESLGQPSW